MARSRLPEVFDRVRASAAAGRVPCCIFDLDSTLLNSRQRSFRILQAFTEARGRRYPGLAERVADIRDEELGYQVSAPLEGHPCLTPGLRQDLRAWWGKRFFTSEWCEGDRPIAGAVEFVQVCRGEGAVILYITGRDTPRMKAGTLEGLRREGFPRPGSEGVELHMKPLGSKGDRGFKARAIEEVCARPLDVVASFENEPGNANLFCRAFPDSLTFLLETVHSPDAEEGLEQLIRIPDFAL